MVDALTGMSLDAWLQGSLAALDRAGLRRVLRRASARHGQGAILTVAGREVVDCSSNDYLGLASHPAVVATLAAAAAVGEAGAGAARLISGNREAHEALETELAAFKGTAAALLFGSGYLANVGAIPALMDRGDGIYADRLNHASLIDGCRLSRATTEVIDHVRVEAFDQALAASAQRYRRRWIVVDSVFSMDGDLAPLADLSALAARYDAWLYVDDAHATGVLGATGRGSAEHWGLGAYPGASPPIAVTMGTLGKALGVCGAFVAGSATLIEYLRHRARTFVYTTGTPAWMAEAVRAALRVVQQEPARLARLRANIAHCRQALTDRGVVVGGDPATPILPIPIGSSERTSAVGEALFQRGFLVGAIRSPTVPVNGARLRITVSAAHEPEQLTALADAVAAVLHAG